MFNTNYVLIDSTRNDSVQNLGSELSGLSLDFLSNLCALRTTSNNELILLQIGNEWNGFAMDFTTNYYAINRATGAETLLGTGPIAEEVSGIGLDFTDNSSAITGMAG